MSSNFMFHWSVTIFWCHYFRLIQGTFGVIFCCEFSFAGSKIYFGNTEHCFRTFKISDGTLSVQVRISQLRPSVTLSPLSYCVYRSNSAISFTYHEGSELWMVNGWNTECCEENLPSQRKVGKGSVVYVHSLQKIQLFWVSNVCKVMGCFMLLPSEQGEKHKEEYWHKVDLQRPRDVGEVSQSCKLS